jgi:putative GTP pyrophosphokinase
MSPTIVNPNPNSELHYTSVNTPDLAKVPDSFMLQAAEFQRAIMMYSCAIREVKTKLEVLNDDLSVRNQRNPIEMIKSRVKKPESIVEKLKRRGFPVTVQSMMNHLDDIAGVRVICSFVDDITVVAVKDYIQNPKENGYRSYHLILEVPVFLSDDKRNIRVEVQIRTIAMDFWASLDHQLKYKKDIGQASESISEELSECAAIIAETDQRMLAIRRKIEQRGGRIAKD